MGAVFSFFGVAWIVLCLAMSVDAYQVEFDTGEDVGPWGKYLLPIILANPGLYFIVEGLKMGFPT